MANYQPVMGDFNSDGNLNKLWGPNGKVAFDPASVAISGVLLSTAKKNLGSSPLALRTVMAAPPTVTANDSTLPGTATNPFLRSTFPLMFRETGGLFIPAQSKFKSAVIDTTGGNLGTGDGAQTNFGRIRFLTDSITPTFRVNGTATPYRFIVDGQYVSTAGTTTTAGAGTQYITLDFTAAGGRKLRELQLELTPGCGFVGVYVGNTDKVYEADEAPFRSVSLGDSYCFGSSATILSDGIDIVMADHLGWGAHMASGSGGTGWATTGTAYTFKQRILNGDLLLNGTPAVVCLQGSINDKAATATAVRDACLAGLVETRRQLPKALIQVFGVWPAQAGTTGTLSVSANEQAISDAVTLFQDPMTDFIPISAAYSGAWLSGSGFVGGTTGTGNADVWMADITHPNTFGASQMGRLKAGAIARSLVARVSQSWFPS